MAKIRSFGIVSRCFVYILCDGFFATAVTHFHCLHFSIKRILLRSFRILSPRHDMNTAKKRKENEKETKKKTFPTAVQVLQAPLE